MAEPFEIIKSYKNLRFVRKGSLGDVFSAETKTGETVAVKRLHPYFAYDAPQRRRFLREIDFLSKIFHPQVPRLLESHADQEENAYFVMEWMEGMRFAEYFSSMEKSQREQKAMIFLHSLLGVLDYFQKLVPHPGARAGLVHGDLSPNNILIAKEEGVRVLDFTCSAWVFEDASYEGGTWGYMPLVQAQRGKINLGNDLFAAALLFAEASTGKSILEGQTTFAVFKSTYEFDLKGASRKITSRGELQEILERLFTAVHNPYEALDVTINQLSVLLKDA